MNHSSDEHPWFVESASSLDNPKRDWYWWRAPRAGSEGAHNNWRSLFGGSAWQFDARTGQSYLHTFSRKQPDLNWENPDVRAAMHEIVRWWLDRGADALRLDVINFISKDALLPDGPVGEDGFGDGRVHFNYGPRLHEFLRELHREALSRREPPILTVGETPKVDPVLARELTERSSNELDMVFHFDHMELDHSVHGKWSPREIDVRELMDSFSHWQDELADVGWNSLYLGNHDQPRPVSRFGDPMHRDAAATALATILHLQRGTPFVYQGEELGMADPAFERIEDYRDIETHRYFDEATANGVSPEDALAIIRRASRDNARTPMHWTSGPNAGFTDGTPWIGINPDFVEVNAAVQRGVVGSVFEHYRALIRMRHTDPLVVDGRFERVGLDPRSPVFAFRRRNESREMFVVANLSSSVQGVEGLEPWADPPSQWETVLSNHPDRSDLVLRPWEAIVFRRVFGEVS